MMKRASLRHYLCVPCIREIPHHPRLHWNREAAMPARPAHAKPLLGLSPVGISAEGSGAHAAISFPSLHSPSWQQLSSWHLQPWPSGISMIKFGLGTLGSNVKDNTALSFTMSYQTRWHKGKKKLLKNFIYLVSLCIWVPYWPYAKKGHQIPYRWLWTTM